MLQNFFVWRGCAHSEPHFIAVIFFRWKSLKKLIRPIVFCPFLLQISPTSSAQSGIGSLIAQTVDVVWTWIEGSWFGVHIDESINRSLHSLWILSRILFWVASESDCKGQVQIQIPSIILHRSRVRGASLRSRDWFMPSFINHRRRYDYWLGFRPVVYKNRNCCKLYTFSPLTIYYEQKSIKLI